MQYEIVPSSRQKCWKWPAVINFVIGGAGAGLCVINSLNTFLKNTQYILKFAINLNAMALLLICAGLSTLLLEAGRPSRGIHIAAHLRTSWISREIVFFIIFFISVVLQFYFKSFPLLALSMVSVIGFMVSQAFIIFRSVAISAWRRPEMPFFFISSSLASGWCLFIIVRVLMNISIGNFEIISGIILISINAKNWLAMILHRNPKTDYVMVALRKPFALLLSIGVGHFLPLFLLIILILIDASGSDRIGDIAIIAGAAAIVGITIQKKQIIMSVGYLNKILINIPNQHSKSGIIS